MAAKISKAILLIALGAAAAYFAFQQSADWKEDRLVTVAAALSGVAGAVVGFIVAGLAILLTVVDRPLLKGMTRAGYLANLLSDLIWTAVWYLCCLFASISTLFLNCRPAAIGLAIAIFFLVVANGKLLRGGRNFILTLNTLSRADSHTSEF